MKQQTFFAVLLLLYTVAAINAQPNESNPIATGEPIYLYSELDEPPSFPGGFSAMADYLNNQLIYPVPAREYAIQGKVRTEIIIGTDGKVMKTNILDGLGYGCDEEVIRVIENMPAWLPGKKDSSKVATKLALSISFNLTL